GGTLQYTGAGAASSDRLFTLGTSGGTIDASAGAGALTLGNAGAVGLAGLGTRTLTLSANNAGANTLAAVLGDDAGPNATSLTKSGAGSCGVTGNTPHSGTTTISAGTLQIGSGGTSGTLGAGGVTVDGTLKFNRS